MSTSRSEITFPADGDASLVDGIRRAGNQWVPVFQILALCDQPVSAGIRKPGKRGRPGGGQHQAAWELACGAYGNSGSGRYSGRAAGRRHSWGRSSPSPRPAACAGSIFRSRRTGFPTLPGSSPRGFLFSKTAADCETYCIKPRNRTAPQPGKRFPCIGLNCLY